MSSGRAGYRRLGFPSRTMYEFPSIVNIEVYRGTCPCKCVHCPVGLIPPSGRTEVLGRKGIDAELYLKIVEELSHHSNSTLRIHSVGEPLDWPGLPEALSVGRDHGVRSWVFTAGVTRNNALLEAVCLNASIVEVSVNSATQEDYRRTKGIDAFPLVSANLRYMHGLRQKGLSFRLLVSRVKSGDPMADREFVDFWKASGLIDDVFIRAYHTYNDLIDKLPDEPDTQKPGPCLVHWARFNISVDGYAVVCFNELFKEVLDPSLIIGDLRTQSIRDVWQSGKMNSLRLAEMSGDYSGLDFAEALPCRACYSCQPLRGQGPTSEHQIELLEDAHGSQDIRGTS